jgi:hypothetical protein
MWISGPFDVDNVENFYKSCGNAILYVYKIVDYYKSYTKFVDF